MYQLRELDAKYYRDILALLRASNFPKIPDEDMKAFRQLQMIENYGIICSGKVCFWAGIFQQDGLRCIDIACLPDMRGKWATRAVLRQLYAAMFRLPGVEEVFGSSVTAEGVSCALSAGFKVAYHIKREDLLAITREEAARLARVKVNG